MKDFLSWCLIEAKLWFFRCFLCRDRVAAYWFLTEIHAIASGRPREECQDEGFDFLRDEIERRGERMVDGGSRE
jgi:hypothetical protein